MNLIDKIISELQEHFKKGNKTIGTLHTDWKLELEYLLEEEYTRGFQDCYTQLNTTGLEIQRECFEAGREIDNNSSYNMLNKVYKYTEFEDYIKAKENGTTK